MRDKEDVLKCARWIVYYSEMDVEYKRITNLTELGIPYKSERGSNEGLVVCTGAGRFSGNRLLRLLKQ